MTDTELYEYWNDAHSYVAAETAETHSQGTDVTSGVHSPGTCDVSEPQVSLGKYMYGCIFLFCNSTILIPVAGECRVEVRAVVITSLYYIDWPSILLTRLT